MGNCKNRAKQQAYSIVCNVGSLDRSARLQIMIAPNVRKSEDKESEVAANEKQHDAREGMSRQTTGVQSKKRKVRSMQDEHGKIKEKWTHKF